MSTLHEAVQSFIQSISNPRTARAYGKALAKFEAAAPASLSMVNETHLMPFADSLASLSAATRDLALSAVVSFFSYLIYTRQSETVSLDRARIIKKKLRGRGPTRISDYPMRELQQLVDYAGGLQNTGGRLGLIALRDRALILSLATTGLRRSEAASLKLRDVDLTAGQAVVIGKGDKQAVVYFSPEALAAIREYIAARGETEPDTPLFMRHDRAGAGHREHVTTETVNHAVKLRSREALGCTHPGIHAHSLRHYFVTSIWKETHDLALAKELARHSNIQMTMRYCHVDGSALKAAHAGVFK